jgi:hypothetical protein
MGYSKSELLLLSKSVLADIILEQERRINLSRRGQPKRDNLVGQTYGALTIVGDAGNKQAHSTWYCRCSGNIFAPETRGVCDNQVTLWGSNLKADRHQYCGSESCPAARQALALKRQKDLPPTIILQTSEFAEFLHKQLLDRFVLMGKNYRKLVETELSEMLILLHNYYGINDDGRAKKIEEIAQILGKNDVSQLKRNLEEYIQMYKLNLVAEELGSP